MKIYLLLTGIVIAYFFSGIRRTVILPDIHNMIYPLLKDELVHRHTMSSMFCIFWGVLSMSDFTPLIAVIICILPGYLLGYIWASGRRMKCCVNKIDSGFTEIKPLSWYVDATIVIFISLIGALIGRIYG